MNGSKLSRKLLLIFLSGCTLALSGCETIQVKNRTPCFVLGEIVNGASCSTTVGTPVTTQLTMQQAIDMIEARPDHAPAVFQSADDYGEETLELETACRLLGNRCTYAIQSTVENQKKILKKLSQYR